MAKMTFSDFREQVSVTDSSFQLRIWKTDQHQGQGSSEQQNILHVYKKILLMYKVTEQKYH
jgi:hypothetical protein